MSFNIYSNNSDASETPIFVFRDNVSEVERMLFISVFRAFDKDNDCFVSVREWTEGLSVFLRGTLAEKIKCNKKAYVVF